MHETESPSCNSVRITREHLATTTDAMRVLGVSRATVARMARDGRLVPLIDDPAGLLFVRADVEAEHTRRIRRAAKAAL